MSSRAPGVLPRLCVVADGFASGRREHAPASVAARVLDAVAAGVPWVALRDRAAGDAAFLRAAGRLAERLRALRPDVRLSVHGRLDAARRLRAGYHATHDGPSMAEAVAAGVAVGASVHGPAEAAAAARDGASYVFASPVWPTATHPGAPALGLDGLRAAASASSVPVLALGGVDAPRAGEALAAGAYGVAVVSALLDAPDVAWAARRLLRAVGADP